MPDPTFSSLRAMPLGRDLNSSFKGDAAALNQKLIEAKILETAISQLAERPGFNPAALSIVFGLKW